MYSMYSCRGTHTIVCRQLQNTGLASVTLHCVHETLPGSGSRNVKLNQDIIGVRKILLGGSALLLSTSPPLPFSPVSHSSPPLRSRASQVGVWGVLYVPMPWWRNRCCDIVLQNTINLCAYWVVVQVLLSRRIFKARYRSHCGDHVWA